MKKQKRFLCLLLAVCGILSLTACGTRGQNPSGSASPSGELRIGIIQIEGDSAAETVEKAVEAQFNARNEAQSLGLQFRAYTAPNDAEALKKAGSTAISEGASLLIPIGTAAAQAIQSAAAETGVPVVFAAVSDPVQAGLVESMEAPGKNMTGTCSIPNSERVLELMRIVNPELKSVGLVFGQDDASQSSSLLRMRSALERENLTAVDAFGADEQSLLTAIDAMAATGVDAVFSPDDAVVLASEKAVSEKLNALHIPQYGESALYPQSGAFLGFSVDLEQMGTAAADMAISILVDGASPALTAVKQFDSGKVSVNTETCAALGYQIDDVKASFVGLCTEFERVTPGTAGK